MSRLYSVIISGYKDTSRRTLSGCLGLAVADAVSFEIIFLDNTKNGRHRVMAEHLFAETRTHAVRTLYVPHATPGKVAAQNKGIANAEGNYFIFLDDDVLPDEQLVVEYDRGFHSNDCAAIQGRVELRFEDGLTPPRWLNDRFRLDLAEMDFGEPIVPFEMGLTGANMAFKRELFEKYGDFDERLGPSMSGTLEDQEYSERIRNAGEVQLFWPHASVQHVIPPERLKLKSFAGIYYDVGHSDFFLSRDLIEGGKIKFSLYTIKRCAIRFFTCLKLLLACRRSDALVEYCEMYKHYGYWKQTMRQMGKR